MVHECQATYFVKQNALAMLNTLFPPGVQRLPHGIPAKVFHLLRSTFYRYLVLIEANGIQVFNGYVRSLEMPGNKYTWIKVRECVADYVKHAEDIIVNAREIYGIDSFSDKHTSREVIPHSRRLEARSNAGSVCISQPSVPPRQSSSGRSSSIETDLISSSHHPIIPRPPTAPASRSLRSSLQHSLIRPAIPYWGQEPETGRRDNSSLEARRRVLQEHRVIALTERPITSDDVILPGTPLLPDTPDITECNSFSIPPNSSTLSPFTSMTTPELAQSNRLDQPYEGLPPGTEPKKLRSKASFTQLLRKKFSVGSSSNSRTLRDTFENQSGLGISLGPSKSVENLPSLDPSIEGSGRPILRKLSNTVYLEDTVSINSSFRSRSGTVWALQTIDPRADALQSEAIKPSTLADSRAACQIKKKRSLREIFSKKKLSPATRDSEPVYLKTDDTYEQYVLLSELQPVQSMPGMPCRKLGKAKSCNTLKSVADSQATVRSAARGRQSTQSRKLVKTRSLGTLRSAADSQVTSKSTIQRTKLQMTPKHQPSSIKLSPETPVPRPRSIRARKPIKFDWNPNSEDWKSREYTRQYYLEKYRAERLT